MKMYIMKFPSVVNHKNDITQICSAHGVELLVVILSLVNVILLGKDNQGSARLNIKRNSIIVDNAPIAKFVDIPVKFSISPESLENRPIFFFITKITFPFH